VRDKEFLLKFALPFHMKVGSMPLKGILLSVMMGFFYAFKRPFLRNISFALT
jgi:hypothetical protein